MGGIWSKNEVDGEDDGGKSRKRKKGKREAPLVKAQVARSPLVLKRVG